MSSTGKIYFASDFHLGVPDYKSTREREKRLVAWLDQIKDDAAEIFLVGDIFDFWFEYGTVVPKGNVRLLGKLAEIRDSGISVYFFIGNHDMWMFEYFEKELDIPIYKKPIQRVFEGKKFYIGHGDGLGPGDHGYKFIKSVFANKICQWLFKWIHPDVGIKIASFWSFRSRYSDIDSHKQFEDPNEEMLVQYANDVLAKEHFDYFVFGHRHLAIDHNLNDKSKYINLGDWLQYNSYAVFDGDELQLKFFNGE